MYKHFQPPKKKHKTNRRLTETKTKSNNHNKHYKRRLHRDPEVYKCVLCKSYHALRFCRQFLKMSVIDREKVVDNHHYCVNCLAKTHDLRACSSMDTCRICDKFHHTLLHPRPQRSRGIKTKQLRKRKVQREKRESEESKPQVAVSTSPDAKIIIEAIRSIAHVLAAEDKSSIANGQGRRHV